jgi:hypothetical protein
MQCRERLDALGPLLRKAQSDDPVVVGVSDAAEEAGRFGPVDEPNRTVVAQEQIVRDFTNGCAADVSVTAYSQEKLVLSRSEAGGTSLLLTPTLEVTQSRPQDQELCVHFIRQGHSVYDIILSRCNHGYDRAGS